MTGERPYTELVSEFLDGVRQKIYEEAIAETGAGFPTCSIPDCRRAAVAQLFPDAMVMLPRPPWWFSCQEHYPSPEQPWPLKAAEARVNMEAGTIEWWMG